MTADSDSHADGPEVSPGGSGAAFGVDEGHLTGRPIDTSDLASAAATVAAEGRGSGGGAGSDELARALAERDEFRSDLQRLAAEFDNFRKRAVREREQAAAAADHRLLVELLAVLDDFERALAVVEGGAAEGVQMVHDRLLSVLTAHGLTEIDTSDGFDPHRHEAMMMQPGTGKPEGTVLVVVQKGYELDGRILRHAKVVVADGSGDAE